MQGNDYEIRNGDYEADAEVTRRIAQAIIDSPWRSKFVPKDKPQKSRAARKAAKRAARRIRKLRS